MNHQSFLLHPQYKDQHRRRTKTYKNLDHHSALMNWILGVAVVLSLWTLWSSPVLNSNSNYQSGDGTTAASLSSYNNLQSRMNKATMTIPTTTPSTARQEPATAAVPPLLVQLQGRQESQQLIPIFLDGNGHPAALIHPRHLQMIASSSSSSNTGNVVFHHQANEQGDPKRLSSPNVRQATTASTNSVEPSQNGEWTKQQQQSPNNKQVSASGTTTGKQVLQTGGSNYGAPVATAFSDSTPRTLLSMEDETTQGSAATVRGTTFLMVASCSIVLGAVAAKKAIDRAQRWEQESQEDSLAYDLAYTETRSDDSYGSFVSTTGWSDELDKFDV
jgi:hypothetical protein